MSRSKSTLTAGFPEYAGESTGGVSYPVFPTINDSPYQQTPNAPLQLGDKIIDRFGYSYVYVRAAAALAVGQVVTLAANQTGTVSAGTTTSLIKTNITTTLDEASIGSFITVSGTTQVQKKIKNQVINAGGAKIGANTNFYVSINDTRLGRGGADGDVLAAVPTTSDPVHIVRPYSVDVCGNAGFPCGVALGTVTSGYRTLVQVSGLARVNSVGSTTAIADNGLVVCIASGSVKGLNAEALSTVLGLAKQAYAGAAALQPIWLWDIEDRI